MALYNVKLVEEASLEGVYRPVDEEDGDGDRS